MSNEQNKEESKPETPSEEEYGNNSPNGVEQIRTISRIPGNANYYEKNGLRTEGDGQDHTHYNYGSIGFIMTTIGCSFALCASQILPLLYLTLGTTIALQLGAPNLTIWMLTANIVAQGALAPFVGPLADLLGRKSIFLVGLGLAVIGGIVCAATPTSAGFLAGQVLLGFGAVTAELLAISVVSETVPTAKRPLYAALVLCSIIPWSPGTLYANWMAESSWRWVGCTLAVWNLLTLVILAVFYRPPPRVNSLGLSRSELLKRIDFVGGGLVTLGLVLFLVGLNRGGSDFPWTNANILGPLIAGAVTLIIFGLYEYFVAPYPLYPRRLVFAPRPFFCMLFVIFAAGINYIPLVVFWPIQSISVFQADRHQSGINNLPIGICILGGAILSAFLLGLFKKHVTLIMTFFCVMQTVAAGCLVLIDHHNIMTAWAPIVLSLIGVGGVLVPNQVIITVITPDDLIASVTALTVGLRAQAQVIGLAIFYNRFVHEVNKNSIKYVVKPVILAGVYLNTEEVITDMMNALTSVPFREYAPTVPELVSSQEAYDSVKAAVIEAFGHSFPLIYYITIAFGVPACIAAAFMGDISKYMDNHVAVVI